MKIKLTVIVSFILLAGCSASYEELKKTQIKKPQTFNDYLIKEYKNKAEYEAEEMHDWNSAKLYSEKALLALNGKEVLPEDITYWELPKNTVNEINQAHKNLMVVYSEAKISDPQNLAIAISALDCWSEQQEEKWQIWDINKCKTNFLDSMHLIYQKIASEKNNKESKESVTVVTKNNENELMQIIYFDFDEELLSVVSINKLKDFINKNNLIINKYIIVGHADKKGTKVYNHNLSLKRAKAVKEILVEMGISNKLITLLGKGEESPAIITLDGIAHPANRRAEIKIVN